MQEHLNAVEIAKLQVQFNQLQVSIDKLTLAVDALNSQSAAAKGAVAILIGIGGIFGSVITHYINKALQ